MGSRYFSDDELSCHCCGNFPKTGMDSELLAMLDDIRDAVGGPIQLSCAYRCPAHNAEVGGVAHSQHVLGKAADILVPDGMMVDELAQIAIDCGADGVGRYYDSDFVHVDVRNGRVGADIEWDDQGE
jgi:uncharacterized protein YcbK (DUF882 family)